MFVLSGVAFHAAKQVCGIIRSASACLRLLLGDHMLELALRQSAALPAQTTPPTRES
jgi:hypothetical protein